MKKCNSVSLTGCDRTASCAWYDDWSCGCSTDCGAFANGCSSGCGWLNGCGGCQNGCSTGCSCLNGCGPCLNSGLNGCNGCGGCNGGCGNWNSCGWISGSSWNSACSCASSCSSLWPDAPALSSGGVLIPRVIGSGRLCQRVSSLTLCVQDIPDCAKAPYALLSVSASGPVDWEFISVERWRAVLRVTIPLTAVIRDCAGGVHTGHSSITVEVPVRITIPTTDLGRAHVTVQPGVRLLCTTGCSEDGCFTVSLAVLVDVYVARWEPSSDGTTIPCRPDLPLTLPPTFHNTCGCNTPCNCF